MPTTKDKSEHDALRAQARRVVSSLADKPSLFYEVLALIADEYGVVGPWTIMSGQSDYWVRLDMWGDRIARVWTDGDVIYCGSEAGPDTEVATTQEGKDKADEALKEAGWLLG